MGCSSHSALVSFPVSVSAGTAIFSALALCSYLGQAYFNSTGTDAGLRPLSRADMEKYWVGSALLGYREFAEVAEGGGKEKRREAGRGGWPQLPNPGPCGTPHP